MKSERLAAIRDTATEFRQAVELCDFTELPPLQRRCRTFPKGACGDTCELLGTYLFLKRGLQFDYVFGWRIPTPEIKQSHAWLELDGLIVDITADQFGDNLPPVIVTFDRSWHSQFTGGRPPRAAGIHLFDERGREYFKPAYEMIMGALLRILRN